MRYPIQSTSESYPRLWVWYISLQNDHAHLHSPVAEDNMFEVVILAVYDLYTYVALFLY